MKKEQSIGWSVNSSGYIAKQIQKTCAELPEIKKLMEKHKLRTHQLATHAFMVNYDEPLPSPKDQKITVDTVYESHYKTKGVHRMLAYQWHLREKKENIIFITDCEFDLGICTSQLGRPYSIKDIFRIKQRANEHILRPESTHDEGLICSEYVALCTKSNIDFCKYYDLEPESENMITPSHIQLWAINEKKPIYKPQWS